VAKPIHEIMAESSAGMARERASRARRGRRHQARNLPSRFMESGNPNLTPAGAVDRTARPNLPPEMYEHTGIMNTLKNLYGKARSGLGKMTQPGYFGGVAAAEINPQKVLASDWAKTPIDWEDLEGGTFSPIGYDAAYKNLKNRGNISTWGDLYGQLQSGGGTGLTNKVLEKGLGDYTSGLPENLFPKDWSTGQVKPTVKSWKERNYFDVDEGALEPGVYSNLQQQDWLLNRGGEVGLEPGIASMMGYAKGGMVTKVRVPKGQSKWMKKFMNNMRDS